MTLTQSNIYCGLVAKVTPSLAINTASPTIGTNTTHTPTTADTIYSVKITAAASSNVATLTIATGDVAQTTGSPTIVGSGEDFEGVDLGTSTKIHGIRLRTSGSGTVTIGGSSSSLLPAVVLQSGSDLVLKFPTAGATLGGSETLTGTFSATGGILEIEALTQ
jgi:hypothetical protein